MSHAATRWAIRQKGLKPTTKIVLWQLCDHHNDELGCFPSQKTLAEECEISRSTLNLHLDELEARGLIKRVSEVDERTKRQRPTRYILEFEMDESRVRNPDNAVSENHTRAVPEIRTEAVSDFGEKPCPIFDESRVRNPDTNPVREPLAQPSAWNAGQSVSQRAVAFRAGVFEALGVSDTALTVTARPLVSGMTGAEIDAHLMVWDAHGLPDDAMLSAIRSTVARQRRKDPAWTPRGLGYFDQPIADLAKRRKQAGTSSSPASPETRREERRKKWASF